MKVYIWIVFLRHGNGLPLDAYCVILLVENGDVVSHEDISEDHEGDGVDAIEEDVAVWA